MATSGHQEAAQLAGATQDLAHRYRDVFAGLGDRLDALCSYDRRIAEASASADLQGCWRSLRRQEQEQVQELKQLIADAVRSNSFFESR
jgi:hypothetical protein